MKRLTFLSLGGTYVRDAQLSDHEPLIDQNVISWNIMMPGNFRRNRYNNGFALIEDQAQYHQRLRQIASVLAEICSQNAYIHTICLQEAPVQPADIEVFVSSCLSYPSLQSFAKTLQNSDVFTAWGLITLVNSDRYDYEMHPLGIAKDNLKDRIQALILRDQVTGEIKTMINLHFPYESKKEPLKMAQLVWRMIRQQSCAFTVAGDFNFSFTHKDVLQMLKQLGRLFAPQNNSTEYEMENGGTNTLESVDAIISQGKAAVARVCNLAQTSLLRFTGGHYILRDSYEDFYIPRHKMRGGLCLKT
jgi:hypothetical protein